MRTFTYLELENNNKQILITDREFECIQLLEKSQTAKQIAKNLKISYRTVETHFYNIRQKTGCKNRYDILKIYFSKQIQNKNCKNR